MADFDFDTLRARAKSVGVGNLSPEEYEAKQKALKEKQARKATLSRNKGWDLCKNIKSPWMGPEASRIWHDRLDHREV